MVNIGARIADAYSARRMARARLSVAFANAALFPAMHNSGSITILKKPSAGSASENVVCCGLR
jgi:hypothetical protein